MSFLTKAKEMTGDLAVASKGQAQRVKIELEMRRLDSKVNSEKDAIGHLLFPLLEAGTMQVDVAEVHERMKAIEELLGKIRLKRAEVGALQRTGGERREDDATAEASSEESAHGDWENEGGHTAE